MVSLLWSRRGLSVTAVILALGVPAAAAGQTVSFSGFGPVKFGTSLARARRALPGARRVRGETAAEIALEPAGTVRLAGRRFRARLRFFGDRLQEVIYTPRRDCRRACLRAIRLSFESRIGRKPEKIADDSRIKTWLWPDLGRDTPWIVVMIQFEADRLIEISVSDQTNQQIEKAWRPSRGCVAATQLRKTPNS